MEDPERGVGEVLPQLDDRVAESQVGLVRTVQAHRVGERDPLDRSRNLHVDQSPQRRGELLAERDDVLLVDEAHLDVELRELRLPVGAEVLVAVAAGQLVVALHAGHHEQLLEQLGRLRQGVPRSRVQTCGNHEVAGALRGGARQRRGLDLDEVVLVEHAPSGLVGLGAESHGRRGAGAAQVEIAVLQARLFADRLLAVERGRDLEGERRRLVEHLDVGGDDLDVAGGQVGVRVAVGTGRDLTGDLEHELAAQRVCDVFVPDDHLGDARRVAKVDEGDAAVIASAIHPPRKGDGLADVRGPE